MTKLISCTLILIACAGCIDRTSELEDWTEPAHTVTGCTDYYKVVSHQKIFYNNVWNKNAAGNFPWQQCIVSSPEGGASQYGWKWSWPDKGKDIFGYPQVRYGVSPWDPVPKIDSRFPLHIETLEKLGVSFELELSAVGEHNVATSFWVIDHSELGDVPQKESIYAEVMVWNFYTDQHISPAGQKITEVSVDDAKWSVWFESSWRDQSGVNENTWSYVTFRAENTCLNCQFDLIALFNALPTGMLDLKHKYLANVELGTEIMRGKGLVWVKKFDLDIQAKGE